MNKNILVFTNHSIEKLVYSAFLNNYKILYLKEFNELANYNDMDFKFIIINCGIELITPEFKSWLLTHKRRNKTTILYISSDMIFDKTLMMEFDSVIHKPYEISEIISLIENTNLL